MCGPQDNLENIHVAPFFWSNKRHCLCVILKTYVLIMKTLKPIKDKKLIRNKGIRNLKKTVMFDYPLIHRVVFMINFKHSFEKMCYKLQNL